MAWRHPPVARGPSCARRALPSVRAEGWLARLDAAGMARHGARLNFSALQLEIEESHVLLAAMHVALADSALREPARVGELDHQQVADDEPAHVRALRPAQARDAVRVERGRAGIPVEILRAVEEEIDRDPERPGVLRTHTPADVCHLSHGSPRLPLPGPPRRCGPAPMHR